MHEDNEKSLSEARFPGGGVSVNESEHSTTRNLPIGGNLPTRSNLPAGNELPTRSGLPEGAKKPAADEISAGDRSSMTDGLPIEAVVFDVGRVIFEWDLRHLFTKLIADPQELEWLVTHVVSEQWHFQADAGRDLDDMVAERKAEFPQYSALIDAYATRFAESIPGPVAGTLDVIEALHQNAIPLFAITNFGAEFWAQFHPAQPVFARFKDIVVSGQEKLAKPDPAIFALAAARFDHDPSAMLFIDDNPENIAAAARCDWQTHQFSNAQRLQEDLMTRGLLDR